MQCSFEAGTDGYAGDRSEQRLGCAAHLVHQAMTVFHPAPHALLIDPVEQAQIRSNAEVLFETASDHDHPNGWIELG
jgi:hypothetical protein